MTQAQQEDLNALRLGRDQLRHQLSVTITQRNTEHALADALAEALRDELNDSETSPLVKPLPHTNRMERWHVLHEYDAARGAK